MTTLTDQQLKMVRAMLYELRSAARDENGWITRAELKTLVGRRENFTVNRLRRLVNELTELNLMKIDQSGRIRFKHAARRTLIKQGVITKKPGEDLNKRIKQRFGNERN